MSKRAQATAQAVETYLASEQGRDAPETVAVRLKRLPWHVLFPDHAPDLEDVHLLRGLIEQRKRGGFPVDNDQG